MVAFARTLARDLRQARKESPQKFRQQVTLLAECMGIGETLLSRNETGGITYQYASTSPTFDRSKQSVRPSEFSVRDLFECLVCDESGEPIGRTLVESFSPRKHGRMDEPLLEAGPVDHSAFSNITGQIVFASILEGFMSPEFIGSRVTRNVPTDIQESEKVPGISLPGDAAESIGENQPYPEVGLSEEWIMTQEKVKRGFIVSLSKEAVFGDKTGVLIDRANRGAEMLGINKEKRILDAVLGLSTLYRRNGGAAQATYGNTHTDGTFDNLEAAALQDWTDVELVELLFDAITDPNTGEPISLRSKQLIVPTALLHTAHQILNATEVRTVTNTSITTLAPSPMSGSGYEILSNQYVKARSSSATAWWLGDFPRGFTYRENWPITTEEQRDGSHVAFSQDTVLRFKASEKGAADVEEPRYAAKGNT